MNWRTHGISIAVFVFVFGAAKLLWENPKIILYFVLAIIAGLAYGAIYLIVKNKTETSGHDKKDDLR